MLQVRRVSMAQVTTGPLDQASPALVAFGQRLLKKRAAFIHVRQIGDATGGDVFEPASSVEAALADAMRKAGHRDIHVEVMT